MKSFLAIILLLALAATVRAGNVQMKIDPASVTWNDATGVMTVKLIFSNSGGQTTAVTAFGSEMYLTGSNGATFTPSTGLLGASTAKMVSLAGAAGYAWSTFNQSVVGGAGAMTPGSGGTIFDHSSSTSVSISGVAAGAMTALYAFHYSGSHNAFTQVYAWVVCDDQGRAYDAGDPTSWAYLNAPDGASGHAVQVTNQGVNLAPDSGSETVFPAPGGTIILSNSGPYLYGQVITATASAHAGYFFAGWSVTGSSTLSNSAAISTSLTVYDNFTLTASFTQGTLTISAWTSTTWVYQNTSVTTRDRHVVALTVSVTADNWGNSAYTTTVTQSGSGVVTPTAVWTAGTLVTPTASGSWSGLTGYLVGGRVNGAVTSAGNLALTGSCTVHVVVTGNVGGSASADVTILVRPLGDIAGLAQVNSSGLTILDKRLNDFGIAPQTDADCDLSGDGHVTAVDRVLLNLILHGLPVP